MGPERQPKAIAPRATGIASLRGKLLGRLLGHEVDGLLIRLLPKRGVGVPHQFLAVGDNPTGLGPVDCIRNSLRQHLQVHLQLRLQLLGRNSFAVHDLPL